jgi:hypothetical protein
MEKHPHHLPGNDFVHQVYTALQSGGWKNIRDMKIVLMPSRARCKFDKILRLVPYYPDPHSVAIQRAMATYAFLPAFAMKHVQRHPLRFHKLTQDDLEREVQHCQSSSKSADTDDDDDDDDEQTTIGDLGTPGGTAATRIVQAMATYRQQFKGSGNGRSDKTIQAYLTGATWYTSSAMLILEEQHSNDSDLYTAAKAEHDTAVRLRKDFTTNITQALHARRNAYLERLRSSVNTMMFIYIQMYCVPWRRKDAPEVTIHAEEVYIGIQLSYFRQNFISGMKRCLTSQDDFSCPLALIIRT